VSDSQAAPAAAMRQIDISEFHRHPAQVIRLVEAGAVIQLTRDGLAVIRIVPEPAAGQIGGTP
jgi:antitoxin (DNA-binding transcriptional repressor) of toxin-antitoxin stability system